MKQPFTLPRIALALTGLLLTAFGWNASAPDWSRGAKVPLTGASNRYSWSETELQQRVLNGKGHVLWYPVDVTAPLIPERLFSISSLFASKDEAFQKLGLLEYPKAGEPGADEIPYPAKSGGARPDFRMGYTTMQRDGAQGVTVSCAGCHASNLFGRKVLGLANRMPRMNEAFVHGKRAFEAMSPSVFAALSGANTSEKKMYSDARDALKQVGVVNPLSLGLDTSLAQVALSLARREPDAYASRSEKYIRSPRKSALDEDPADSKPATWWTLRYKNRWLSDGSLVAGNPILTNFLWNEIGRGTDLHELEAWLSRSQSIIDDLTTAVFDSRPVHITEFIAPERIDLARARRGEAHFNRACARCHGTYEKNWSLPEANQLPLAEQLKTSRVLYHETTPVVDVGTDSYRWKGMSAFSDGLNRLELSRRFGIEVEPQKGYVPPPLVGIWARWPYFHNNSAPSLCAVLTRGSDRPKSYYMGEAEKIDRDFDLECNGYPLDERTPSDWKKSDRRFDASRTGLSRKGHDEGIFLKNGAQLFTPEEKRDLIVFLQTL